MKRFVAGIGAVLLGVSVLAACDSPHREAVDQPAIYVKAAHHVILTGERILVSAKTYNLVGGSPVRWVVSPSTAQITSGGDSLVAWFTANEPGTYVITATADAGNGRMVEDSTNVVVNGPTLQSGNMTVRQQSTTVTH